MSNSQMETIKLSRDLSDPHQSKKFYQSKKMVLCMIFLAVACLMSWFGKLDPNMVNVILGLGGIFGGGQALQDTVQAIKKPPLQLPPPS